jgi:hypothetical protein
VSASLPGVLRRHDHCRIDSHATFSPARDSFDAVSALRIARRCDRAGSLRGDCVVYVPALRAGLVSAAAQRTSDDGDGHRSAGTAAEARLAMSDSIRSDQAVPLLSLGTPTEGGVSGRVLAKTSGGSLTLLRRRPGAARTPVASRGSGGCERGHRPVHRRTGESPRDSWHHRAHAGKRPA